jgi:transposase
MRPPIRLRKLNEKELSELDALYRHTKEARIRTRAQMVLLAAEQQLTAPQIGKIVRKDDQTVRNWVKRYNAEGINGLFDAPRPGAPAKVTPDYREQLISAVRRRPRSLGLPYSLWTLERLADYMAEQTGIRVTAETVRAHLKAAEIVISRPQHTISSPDPEYMVKKKTIEAKRDNLKPSEVFYYADEFNISWQPTLRGMWGPKGQQVMIPTPGQPKKHYGIGGVNYHTGETVILIRKRKRRPQVAEFLQTLVDKHPDRIIYVAWDNYICHQDDEVEAVVRGAAGRLVLLYLPTYSPWLNPIEMLWRHFRREVTHCELFETVKALLQATQEFFDRHNQMPEQILSIIGSNAA